MFKKIIFSLLAVLILMFVASNDTVYQFVSANTGVLQIFRYAIFAIGLLCIFFMKSFTRSQKLIISVICCAVFVLSEMQIHKGGVM
ncbi:hypothetical protein C9J40_19515 [Photobacterium sp. GB-72]|nr:hypothetical protein C9J40_19515 [Photobacterium sp. GB-72]